MPYSQFTYFLTYAIVEHNLLWSSFRSHLSLVEYITFACFRLRIFIDANTNKIYYIPTEKAVDTASLEVAALL